MKALIFILGLMASATAFATGGFECTTRSGETTVIGTTEAGGILQSKVYILHKSLKDSVELELSMNWINYHSEEIKAVSYDVKRDVQMLYLDATRGRGRLDLNLVDMIDGSKDIEFRNRLVDCIIE
jgi:hypothetical protein